MKATLDTNVLLRGVLDDNPGQRDAAASLLRDSETIAVPLVTLCEFAWVMRSGYKKTKARTAAAIRALLADSKVACVRPAVGAGLAVLEAGGDFADGVIAFEGRRLGGEVFATFDRKAAKLLEQGGQRVRLLSSK